jgi:hypothetical protein
MTNRITQKLYAGKVEIDFFPDRHIYKIAGRKDSIISVTAATGIIDKSRFLVPWAVGITGTFVRQYLEQTYGQSFTADELYPILDEALDQHRIRKEKAADIGDIVHDFAQNFAKYKFGLSDRDLPEINRKWSQEAINGVNAFLDWYNGNKVDFMAAERLVYSKKHDFVGMADAIAVVNGKKMLIDYKTGKHIYNEYLYQVSGYMVAYEEETGEQLDGAIIIHFKKDDGEFSMVEMSRKDFKLNKPVFLSCLTIKRREKELSKNLVSQAQG